MRTAVPILFTALFLWLSIAAFPQAGQAPKSPAVQPGARPATAPAAARPATAPPAARPAPAPAKPAATAAPKEAAKPDPSIAEGQKALKELQETRAKRQQAEDFIHEWFRRWNALDGKEESLNSFMELYKPDATFEIGPNERQLGGSVMYEGAALIRKMAEDFSTTWNNIAYRPAMRTVDEKTVELIQTSEAPWGGTQVGVEFTGGQASAETKKRFMLRGAAFFEIQNGKLSYVRIYTPNDEMLEITGPTTVSM